MENTPEKVTLTVPDGQAPERLDRFLSRCLAARDLSRSRIQVLLKDGLVTADGAPAKARITVTPGMEVTLTIPPSAQAEALPEDIPLAVLYEDTELIVINKAHGMVVHPAAGNSGGTVVNALLYHCRDSLSGIGGVERPGIVHRLDKDTSGCLVAAKNDHAHHALVSQFSSRTTRKVYLAVVEGVPTQSHGRITTHIARDPHNRLRMCTVSPPHGKEAITDYEVIGEHDGCALIRCRILTGRTHQIRVHMRHLGHAILGDPIYSHPGRQSVAVPRLMLHALELEIDHPTSGQRITFAAPVPEAFARWTA